MKLDELQFKAEDFIGVSYDKTHAQRACDIANHILREKLEKAQVIYGTSGGWTELEDMKEYAFNTARLVCIEEVKK